MSDPSDPSPERPSSMEDVTAEKESDGQVSEAGGASLRGGADAISDADSVAGQPEGESGGVQEPDEAGPNAVPEGNRESNRVDHDIDHDAAERG